MRNNDRVNGVIFWVGIGFIVWCLAQSIALGAAAQSCDKNCDANDPICIPCDLGELL